MLVGLGSVVTCSSYKQRVSITQLMKIIPEAVLDRQNCQAGSRQIGHLDCSMTILFWLTMLLLHDWLSLATFPTLLDVLT